MPTSKGSPVLTFAIVALGLSALWLALRRAAANGTLPPGLASLIGAPPASTTPGAPASSGTSAHWYSGASQWLNPFSSNTAGQAAGSKIADYFNNQLPAPISSVTQPLLDAGFKTANPIYDITHPADAAKTAVNATGSALKSAWSGISGIF